MIADYLAENNWVVALGGLSVMIGFVLALKTRKSLQEKSQMKKAKKKEKVKSVEKPEKSEKTNSKKAK